MRTRSHIALPLVLAALVAGACKQADDQSPVVASVYGHELHRSDLQGLVSSGMTAEDSAAITTAYIDQWVRQMVMLDKAEKNVTDDFSRQLTEYRNSLLTYAYEQQIVDQMLDTVVRADQIEEYYNSHQNEFPLSSSVVRAVYVVAPRKHPADAKLRAITSRQQFEQKDLAELEETAALHNLQGYYEIEQWMPFYSLQTSVPITTRNDEQYLRQTRQSIVQDDSACYYLRIVDYRLAGAVAPLELQQGNIRAIILNHRKTTLISKMQADLIREAEEGGHISRP